MRIPYDGWENSGLQAHGGEIHESTTQVQLSLTLKGMKNTILQGKKTHHKNLDLGWLREALPEEKTGTLQLRAQVPLGMNC